MHSARRSDRVGMTRRPSWDFGMLEVVVGVTLTAVLGGLLVPFVKGHLDRRSERYSSSVALVDTLADSLWAYWHIAVRVAYYGRQGQRGSKNFDLALRRFDSDDSWQIGSDVQTQLSRSKRFLPRPAQEELVKAQQQIVDYLDHEIDKRRDAATPDEWEELYKTLMTETRPAIDDLLVGLIRDLKIGRTQQR
jgi:phage protein U